MDFSALRLVKKYFLEILISDFIMHVFINVRMFLNALF